MEGTDQIWRKCTGSAPYVFSEWVIPVPAEVSWTSPRLRISVLPMESLLGGGRQSSESKERR